MLRQGTSGTVLLDAGLWLLVVYSVCVPGLRYPHGPGHEPVDVPAGNRLRRHQTNLAVVLFDLDDFGSLSRRYGEPQSESLLRAPAVQLRDDLRQGNAFGRWDDDAFVVVAPHTGLRQATTLAERLCGSIARRFATLGELTASFGVSAFELGDMTSA